MNKSHHIDLLVQIEDTDYSGVVHHPNYLHYLERGRVAFFKALGLGISAQAEAGQFYVIRHIDITYLQPARLENTLRVVTEVTALSAAQITFSQRVERLNPDPGPLVDATVFVVSVNAHMKPTRLQTTLREILHA